MGYFTTTDFSLLSTPPKAKGGDGDFVRGVKQSWQELQGTAAGAVGLAGAGLGIDRMKDWGLEVAEEKFAKSAAMGKPYDSLENIESVGNAVDWAQRGLGYVGAQAVPAILSGGVGSILGKKLVQKGIEELLKKGLTEEAKKLAVKASIRGAAAGAGASSYAQEAGSIYPDMVKEGHDEPGRAAAFAAPAAALDVLPQLRAAKAILGPAERETLKGMRRVGMETAKQAGAEGLTEGAQTAIERAAAYKDLNSADAWWEYANAAALGALGGGVLGGGAELVLGRDPVDLTKPGGAPTTESSVPATKSAAELGISRKTPYDPLARELQTPAAPGKDAAPLIIPGGAPTDNEGSPTGGGDQRVAVPSLGISRSLRDQYGAALEKQSRGELLTAAEVGLLKDPPPTPSIILPGQELPPPASVPQIILDGRVARAPTPPPATRAAAAAPPTPTWKQSARRAFIGAKGRGKSIQTVMAADNPQAAAQLAREIAYESTSSAEVRALDAVHKMLTGQTFDQYDKADMERARQLEVVPEIKTVVDEKAHEAATSPLNDTPQPTQAAAEAGKYKKGKIEVAGVNIDVENPAGSKRRGVGEDGKAWESTLATHYGYVPGTVAADSTKQQKQGVDVVVKPGTPPEWEGQVFVVNQNKPDGTFDEHKAVFGAASADEARELYLSNYPQGWERRIRSIVPMTPEQFMVWAKDTGPSGPKAGALRLNRDLTQNVEKSQPPAKGPDPEVEWDEEYRTKPEEPRFKELSATHKERWVQAVEDGYATGELFDEITRDTRAVKLADEIKAKAGKSAADIDGRGRKKRKEKAAGESLTTDDGIAKVREVFPQVEQAEQEAKAEKVLEQRMKDAPSAESVKTKPGANTARLAALLGPKLYGDPSDLPQVSVKELFQNAYDAVKAAIKAKGAGYAGLIKIHLDEKARTIRIVDNGSGMPVSVMTNEFLQIAGTFKETDRASGGLGIAKMLFLLANESLEVVSARDGKIATLRTTGPEILASMEDASVAPEVAVVPFEKADKALQKLFPQGSGTSVTVTVPESYTDSDGEKQEIVFSQYLSSHTVLKKSMLLDPVLVEYSFGDGRHKEAVELGIRFPKNDYVPLIDAKFDWGTARIYASKDEQKSGWGANMHVLSNGLWQFSSSLSKDPLDPYGERIPRTFYVDASPSVPAEDYRYPFDLNRQQFAKRAREDLDILFRYVSLLYKTEEAGKTTDSFGQLLEVSNSGRIESTLNLTPPNAPEGLSALIKPGDKVEIIEGKLKINGRDVPTLTREQLKELKVTKDQFSVPEDSYDPAKPYMHSNLVWSDEQYEDGKNSYKVGVEAKEKAHAAKVPRPKDGESFLDYAMRRWGKQFVQFNFQVARLFSEVGQALRESDTTLDMIYNEKPAIFGTSYDTEYRGVSTRLPMHATFINPVLALHDDPKKAAVGIRLTMVHEIAHERERGHDAIFVSELQKYITLLEAHGDGYTSHRVTGDLEAILEANKDMVRDLRALLQVEGFKQAGKSLTEGGQSERVREGAGGSDREVGQRQGRAGRGARDAGAARPGAVGAAGVPGGAQGSPRPAGDERNEGALPDEVPDRQLSVQKPSDALKPKGTTAKAVGDIGELGTRQYSIGAGALPSILASSVEGNSLSVVRALKQARRLLGDSPVVAELDTLLARVGNTSAASRRMPADTAAPFERIHAALLEVQTKSTSEEDALSVSLDDLETLIAAAGGRQASIQKPSDALKPKGTTTKAVGDIVKKLTGERANWRVTTFKDLEEAEDFINKKRDEAGQFGRNIGLADYDGGPREKLKPGTQAWVEKGKAYFILSEIRPGEELAVFLHEVGKHLGMESLLKKSDQDQLASQIRKWAAKNDGSLESVTAQKALERLALTGNEVQILQNQDGFWRVYNYDGKLVNGVMEKTEKAAIDKAEVITGGAVTEHQLELPAYFIEEAVKAGVNPTAMSYKTPMARFLRKLWAIYKAALRKLGISAEKLTAQDVVDLAYGAARGALATKWHGSPATNIRKFAPQVYRGTGEGRQRIDDDREHYRDMVAWGTYLADRRGTGETYREQLAGNNLILADGTALDEAELGAESWQTEDDSEQMYDYNPKLRAFLELRHQLRNLGVGNAGERTTSDRAFRNAISSLATDVANEKRDLERAIDEDDMALQLRAEAFIREGEDAIKALEEWRALGPVRPSRGALYATDTTVADDEWLDWEKPFHRQSKKVQAALNKLDVNPAKWASLDTGQTMYDVLVDEHGGSQRVVSQLLDKHGIKGVRYPDGGSRRQRDRTVRVVAAEVPYRILAVLPLNAGSFAWKLRDALNELPKFDALPKDQKFYIAELLESMLTNNNHDPVRFPMSAERLKASIDRYAASEPGDWTAEYAKDVAAAHAIKAANYAPALYALRHVRLEPAPKPTYNYVVFNGKNIVVARQDPNARQESQRQYSVAPAMKEIAKAVQVDNLGRSRRGILGLQFLRDIKDEYAERLPAVKAFVDRTFEMAATANELLKKAGRTAKRWASLGKSEAESLANLQAVATVMGIHPDIPLDDKDHLTAGAQTISNKHLMQQDKTFAHDVRAAHANLAAQWAALSPEAKGVYTSARDEMASNWTKREELLNKTIHRYFDPEIAKAKAAKNEALARSLEKERKDYLKEFGRLLSRVKGPYFPLSRFGDFYVVHKSQAYLEAEAKLKEANDKLRELYTKYDIPEEETSLINAMNVTLAEHNLQPIKHLSDAAKKEIREARRASSAARKVVYDMQGREEHYANEAFESESKARARAAELGVSVRLKEDYLREVSSTSYAMINKIGDAIEGSIGDKRVAMQAREAMMRIWLQSLPDTSALRHQLKRKNVAGFSKDMLRSFSQYSQRDAHYLSRLTHMDDIVDSLFQLRRDTRGKGLEGEELYNELARRYAASLKYVDTPVQDAISALAFVFQLGVSPAFLLANLSQPFMISLPIMAAKHGLRRSTGAMASAWADVWKAATTSLRDQRTMAFEIATGNFTDGEQQMLQKTLKAGLLEITLEYDLGALAEGGETHVKKATRAMAIVPHQVEVVNRMATALAAYRMEVAKSGQEKATEHAMDVVSRTHYDYSAANAPYFLKPGVVPMSKLIFQYRKYQLGTLTLLARQIGAAFKGESPEVRAEAKRALFGLAAMHATFAGAMGLPFVGTLTFLANVVAAAFGDDDQPFDAEAAMRNWFADVLGKDAGAVAAKGIPMLFGADFSNKVGMGSIAAPIRVLRDNKEGRDLYLEALAAMAGPAIGGLGPRIADGFKQMEDGNLLKAAEMFTPKFASDVIKAARLTTEGQVTKGGNVSIKPEEVSAWDAALAGLGISPASLTERSAATAAVFDAKEDLKKRRGELERKYVKARVDGDSEAMSEVRAQIDAFNAKRKERGEPTIKTADLLNAYKQRRNYDKNRTEEGVSLNRREKALGQYGRFADTQ